MHICALSTPACVLPSLVSIHPLFAVSRLACIPPIPVTIETFLCSVQSRLACSLPSHVPIRTFLRSVYSCLQPAQSRARWCPPSQLEGGFLREPEVLATSQNRQQQAVAPRPDSNQGEGAMGLGAAGVAAKVVSGDNQGALGAW